MAENKQDLIETKDFTLPNGDVVKLGILKEQNFENLTKWIRQQYMKNIREVIAELPKEEQDSIMLRVVKDVAMMTSRTEDGLKVLYESVHGYARMCYELLQNPQMDFEQFDKMVFEGRDYVEGLELLNKMFYTVYGEMFAENMDVFFGDDEQMKQEAKKVLDMLGG